MIKNKLFLGIDVSKGYSDFIAINDKKEIIKKNFQLDDNIAGHQLLLSIIKEFSKEYLVICAVENTGGYEMNWVQSLQNMSKKDNTIEVYKVNPKAVKHQIQSLLKTTIDDAVSAQGIAIYVANNYTQFKTNWENSMSQKDSITEGKMLHSMIQSLIKQKTMKTNQLEKLLYQSFPEILTYMKYTTSIWVYKFLEKYPSAEATKRAKLKGIESIKSISSSKALELKEKARNSISAISGKVVE